MADTFCELLKEAMKDEMQAPPNYEKLKAELSKIMPPEAGEWESLWGHPIDKIISDEKFHLEILKRLDKEFCK